MRPIEISIFLWLCSFHLAYSKIKDPGKKKIIQKVSGEANYWKAQEPVYEDDATTTDVDFTTQKPIRHIPTLKNHTKEKTSTAKLPAKKKTEIGTERERKARNEGNKIEGPEPPLRPRVTKKNTKKPTKETAKSTLPPSKNPQSPALPSGFVEVQKTVKSNSKKKSIILSRKLKTPSPPGFGLKKDKRQKGDEVLPTPGMLPPQRKISNDNDLEDDPDDDHSREVEEPRSNRKNSVKSNVPLSTAKKVGDTFVTTPKMPTRTQKPKSSKIRFKHTPKTTTTTRPTSTTTVSSSNENEDEENKVQDETAGTTGTDEFAASSNAVVSSFEPVDTTGTIILMSSKGDFEDEATTITTRLPTTLPPILSSIATSPGKRQCRIEVK